ncbi:MAG: map1 [Chlamydiales bacterium]|jgi:methionyl aminopeptidase|nr:map1 [Chlamydiales bacterium]
MIERNDTCWCGSDKKWKKCHYPDKGTQAAPQQLTIAQLTERYRKKYDILIKTPEQIEGIRQACKLSARILDAVCQMAKEGVTTNELNNYAHKLHLEAGAIPAPLHYGSPPFPKSICTSLNEVICHGIPDDQPLKNGDIMNIDVTAILNGYYGDCSRMVMIGSVSPDHKRVVEVSYECMMKSIEILKPGLPLSKIGETIEDYATKHSCSVVYQFVGHGVGVGFHEGPQVFHNRNQQHIPLIPGMTFTIEPMINAGVPHAVIDMRDGWTARTRDGKPSAQWEHTVLITDTGYEILTAL